MPVAGPLARSIRLTEALPCYVEEQPGKRCGQDATVAMAHPNADGTWILSPVCRRHTERLAAQYLPGMAPPGIEGEPT